MSVYPAKNTKEASKLLIEVSNQLHEIVNEDATSAISTDSGLVPSVRKALSDTFLFQPPIPWEQGRRETAFNQLRTFGTDLYWAPSATLSSPKPMGATPIGDPNWKLAPVRLDKSTILTTLGKTSKGFWDENPTLENENDFVVERSTGNVFGAITLPYQVDSDAHPDPNKLLPDPSTGYAGELVDVSHFIVSENLSDYTNIVYKPSGGKTAFENLIIGNPISAKLNQVVECENGSLIKRISESSGDASDFQAININILDFANLDGTDETSRIIQAATCSEGAEVVFPKRGGKSSIISRTINFAKPKSIDFGDLSISYDRNSVTQPVTIGVLSVTKVSDTTKEVARGDSEIECSTTSGLSEGDVINLYNPVDYSWSQEREQYRQSEYKTVDSIAGNTIKTKDNSLDNYPSSCEVYHVPMQNFIRVKGRLKIKNTGSFTPTSGETAFGLRIFQYLLVDISGLDVELENGTHALDIHRCMTLSGSPARAFQKGLTGTNQDYGLVINGVQNCDVFGEFHAERHGATFTTDNAAGAVINRNGLVRGRITSTGAGGVQAADCHANSENITFGGYIEGATLSGGRTLIQPKSTVISPKSGIAPLKYGWIKTTQQTASDIDIIQIGDTPSRAPIECSANSDGFNAGTDRGGDFDFSKSSIIAPDVTGPIISIRNRGSNVSWGINLKDATYSAPSSSGNGIQLSKFSGKAVDRMYFDNKFWSVGISGSDADTEFYGVELSGKVSTSVTTSDSFVSEVVAFAHKMPRAPRITTNREGSFAGSTTYPITNALSVTTTGFTIRTATANGDKFSGDASFDITWEAKL